MRLQDFEYREQNDLALRDELLEIVSFCIERIINVTRTFDKSHSNYVPVVSLSCAWANNYDLSFTISLMIYKDNQIDHQTYQM